MKSGCAIILLFAIQGSFALSLCGDIDITAPHQLKEDFAGGLGMMVYDLLLSGCTGLRTVLKVAMNS